MEFSPPDTRNTLLTRLRDRSDAAAWDEFVEIYRPLVYRLARAKGLQDADAQEVAQDVLAAVSRSIDRFDTDPAKGRFRDWLFRIARNLTINYLSRPGKRPVGSGDTGVARFLDQQCDPSSEESQLHELEYRREVFHWAARQVRSQVQANTWSAFWQRSVEGLPATEVAQSLGISVGAVHIARSRVIGRLREIVKRFDADNAEPQ